MSNQILLNFAVPFTEILSTGDVDTTYLRKVAILVYGKQGVPEGITEVYDADGLAALTDNTNGLGFLNGGLNKLYVITMEVDGDGAPVSTAETVQAILDANENKFFTLFISSDLPEVIVTGDVLTFDGVRACEFTTRELAEAYAVNHCAAVSTQETRGDGLCYALGKLLSTSTFWGNQQYVDYAGGSAIETISSLGLAESYFDSRLTFWLFDETEGTKLAGFFNGGDAITQKYIDEELKLNIQSEAVSYISVNQPMNVFDMRVSLQNELQAVVNEYVDDDYLDPDGENTIIVTDSDEDFFVNGTLSVKHAQPIWRMAVTAFKE